MRWILAFVPLLMLAACTNHADQRASLIETSRAWSEAAQSRDVEAALAYWADDALLLPPGMPPFEGKAAIREFVEGAFATPEFSIQWTTAEAKVAGSGDMGYTVEDNVSTVPDGAGGVATIPGRAVCIWRKEPDGSWRCVVDIWNELPAE